MSMSTNMNNLQVIFPSQRQDVRAKVVEHTLVATFRTSNPPTVWRMDMEKNHSFAVAIQKRADDWELGVLSPKGDFNVVARFDDRERVDAAMAEVEAAMFSNPNSTGIKVWRLSAMTAAMVLLIITGYLVIMWLGPNTAPSQPPAQQMGAMRSPTMPTDRTAYVPPAAPQSTVQTPNKGIPIEADAILGK